MIKIVLQAFIAIAVIAFIAPKIAKTHQRRALGQALAADHATAYGVLDESYRSLAVKGKSQWYRVRYSFTVDGKGV
jgi:hypothetical protein